MTVKELKELLEQVEDDVLVVIPDNKNWGCDQVVRILLYARRENEVVVRNIMNDKEIPQGKQTLLEICGE